LKRTDAIQAVDARRPALSLVKPKRTGIPADNAITYHNVKSFVVVSKANISAPAGFP